MSLAVDLEPERGGGLRAHTSVRLGRRVSHAAVPQALFPDYKMVWLSGTQIPQSFRYLQVWKWPPIGAEGVSTSQGPETLVFTEEFQFLKTVRLSVGARRGLAQSRTERDHSKGGALEHTQELLLPSFPPGWCETLPPVGYRPGTARGLGGLCWGLLGAGAEAGDPSRPWPHMSCAVSPPPV